MPEWTRRLTRELDTFAEQNATTTLPVPIALNQPPEPLRLGPSDDAEWAAFAAETVLHRRPVTAARPLPPTAGCGPPSTSPGTPSPPRSPRPPTRAPEVESAVLPLRARISVRAGLGNLATGLRPPATGHDNPHYFDDAACVRACRAGRRPPRRPWRRRRTRRVRRPLHPGRRRCARRPRDGRRRSPRRSAGPTSTPRSNAALVQLPEGTEIGRNARHAVRLARDFVGEAAGAFALVPLLEHQIVDHVYSYGIAAAETVPVALALTTAARGEIAEAVPAAACLSRVADSAPALAGALTGALGGGAAVPAGWRDACRTLAGCALPRLAGTDLIELAGLLADTEPAPSGGQFRHDADSEQNTHRARSR